LGCLDENILIELFEDLLSDDARQGVDAHLDSCAACREVVAAFAKAGGSDPPPIARTNPTVLGAPPLPAAHTAPLHRPGRMIDHFRVLRMIGRGGMAEVYLARDTKLGRKVALKVVRRALLGSDEAVARFEQEARTTARFSHPNIVTIHWVGSYEGRPYVALEYVEGRTLRARVRERPMSVPEILRVATVVAEALQEAHRHGIAHRDLKPDNILLGTDGRPRILDFGLADIADAEAVPPSGPSPGSGPAAGTPGYMAPEQWRGEPVGPPADIWALGVILFRLIAGRRPFDEATPSQQRAAVVGTAPAPRLDHVIGGVPDELAELVETCLAKQAEARPTARALADGLRELRHGRLEERAETEGPFRGLLAFQERHSAMFFGRDEELAAFVDRMELQAVLPIVGPSGAGKSSFVRAGVIPRLREQQPWRVIALRPGPDPFRSLAAALDVDTLDTPIVRAPSTTSGGPTAIGLREQPARLALTVRDIGRTSQMPVMLFVDQLEELFTLVGDAETQAAFLSAIFGAADDPAEPVRLVFTLRDDFLGRMAMLDEVCASLTHVTVLHRPDARALRQVLTRPLEALAYEYESPELVDDMIAAAKDEPVCLPLLEFTAEALWRARDEDSRRLTRAAYEAMGGVAGALAQHADGVIASLAPQQRGAARTILTALVTSERTRRSVRRSRLIEGQPAAGEILDRLVAARLISVGPSTRGDPHLELAHEALISKWSQLTRWLDESADDLAFARDLEEAAELWVRRGQKDEEVWGGAPLTEALAKLERTRVEVPASARAFLEAGQRRVLHGQRRRRLGVSFAFIALAAVAATLAYQRQVTAEQRAIAETRQAAAELEGAWRAFAQDKLRESRARLRSAFELRDSVSARALSRELTEHPVVWGTRIEDSSGGELSPDGTEVAIGAAAGAIRILSWDSGELRSIHFGDKVHTVAWDSAGEHIAAGNWAGEAGIWTRRGELRRRFTAHAGGLTSVDLFGDGRTLVTAGFDGDVRVWDVASGQLKFVLPPHPRGTIRVQVVRDRIVTGASDGRLRIHDDRGRLVATLDGHDARIGSISSAAGLVATGGSDGQVIVWDVAEAKARWRQKISDLELRVVALSNDGERLLIVDSATQGWLARWRTGERRVVHTMPGGQTRVGVIGPSGDDFMLVTGVLAYRVRADRSQPELPPVPGGRGIAVSPDGQTVASSAYRGELVLLDAATGRRRAEVDAPSRTSPALDWSPDGEWIAVGHRDYAIRVFDPKREVLVATLRGHTGRITSIRFAKDSRRLLSTGQDGTVRVWRVPEMSLAYTLEIGTRCSTVDASDDLRQLAVSSNDGIIRFYDLDRGTLTREVPVHAGPAHGIDFDARGRLWSVGADSTVRRIDGDTVETIAEAEGRLYGIDVAPDSETIAYASSSRVAYLRQPDGETHRLGGHYDEANLARFAPDGSWLITTSDDASVRRWDTASGRPMWRVPGFIGALGPTARAAAQSYRELVVLASVNRACAIGDGGQLDVWDVSSDQRVLRFDVTDAQHLTAWGPRCAFVADGRAQWIDATRPALPTALAPAERLGAAGDTLLLLADRTVDGVGLDGHRRLRYEVPPSVTAIAGLGSIVYVGYAFGEVLRVDATGVTTVVPRGETGRLPVVALAAGLHDTVAVGFAAGKAQVWHAPTRSALRKWRLVGPAEYIRTQGNRVEAMSLTGDRVEWTLTELEQGWCASLRQLWSLSPEIWRDGQVHRAGPPDKHRCR